MENHLAKQTADKLAQEYIKLIGQPMPYPYSALEITSITVEKNKNSKGFSVILSHDIFDGGWPEVTNFSCPQVDLLSYLEIPEFL